MNKLKVIYIEDDPFDSMVVERFFKKEQLNFDLHLTTSIEDTKILLEQDRSFDVVISDYKLKDGDAFDIFDIGYPAPVVFITGVGDEEIAVRAMKRGAYDYVIKDKERNYLKMLPFTIINAYQNYQVKGQVQLLEASIINANDAILMVKADLKEPRKSRIIFQNEAFTLLTGFYPNETANKNFDLFIGEQTNETTLQHISNTLKNLEAVRSELIVYKRDGEAIWVDLNIVPIFGKHSLQTHFVCFARDISLNKKYEEDLKRAKLVAEEAKKAEEHFLAIMSHEIRTPLNAVVGLSNLLFDTEPTGEQLDYIRSIKTSSDNLLALVNDILDLSKIESGKIDFANSEFNLEEALKNIIRSLKYTAEDKGLKVLLYNDIDLPVYVKGDVVRLNQILTNLLGNAIKFTAEGEVTVKTKVLEKNSEYVKIEFQIIDTGIGIDSHKIDKVFGKFRQEDESISSKYGGSGLGLFIVKQLVSLQHGTIKVTSKKNEGSVFTVVLQFGIGNTVPTLDSPFQSQKNLQGCRVLLGEDNLMNRRIVTKMLEKWKAVVDVVINGEELINKLKQQEYDIILSDIQMPELDGVRAINFIRNELQIKTPIIVMTASAFSNKHEVIKEDIDGFIQKPFNPVMLFEMISNNINRKSLKMDIPSMDTGRDVQYDLSYLYKVSGNNEEFVREMIEIFIVQADEVLEILPSALEQKDWTAIEKEIHKFKSSTRNIGSKQMSEHCTKTEKVIQDLNTGDTSAEALELVEQLLEKCRLTKKNLLIDLERIGQD